MRSNQQIEAKYKIYVTKFSTWSFFAWTTSIYKRTFPYRSCHKLIFSFFYYCFKSTFARLSPPPWGWSTGFVATPRTIGRLPNHQFCLALWSLCLPWRRLDTIPMVAQHQESMSLSTPKGNHTIHCGVFSNFLIIWAKVLAARINFAPWPRFHSILCTHVPTGILANLIIWIKYILIFT